MKDEEKKLIENLFHRLKSTELNTSERDNEANSLIQDLVNKQPYSAYYMTQTILIQETAIKKLSLKVEELTNKISSLNLNKVTKKPSFLSSFFKKEPTTSEMSNNNIWKKDQNIPGSYNPLSSSSPTISTNSSSSGGNSGFLKNALQTATGVAGGMILGNMLMNIFNHSKPEEEVFNTINESSIYNIEDHEFHPDNDNHLVDYDNENHFYNSENMSSLDDDHINETSDMNNTSDISDINDDNFI